MPSRTALRHLSAPVAIAYTLVLTLALLVRATALLTALLAEVTDRLADAGMVAAEAIRGTTTTQYPAYTTGGAR